MSKPKIVKIDDVEYVRKGCTPEMGTSTDGMPYVIIRTYSAGVHAGFLASREGKEVVLKNTRRIWYWSGAATLSELSTEGSCCPTNCKIPAAIPEITLLEAIEIIPCTVKAQKMIQECPIWAQKK